jgi:hypothetical protein
MTPVRLASELDAAREREARRKKSSEDLAKQVTVWAAVVLAVEAIVFQALGIATLIRRRLR